MEAISLETSKIYTYMEGIQIETTYNGGDNAPVSYVAKKNFQYQAWVASY